MATFKVNGVSMSTTEGAATVAVSSRTFTLSWSGLYDGTSRAEGFYFEFENPSNLDVNEATWYYTTTKWGDNDTGGYVDYELIDTSGSVTLTATKDLYGATMVLTHVEPFQDYYITFAKAYSVCTSPTSVKVNDSATNINASSPTVSLTCSGAKSGTNNSISAYYVQYIESEDGVTWGSTWTSMANMTKTQATSGYPAESPSVGKYRKYRIKTKGSVSGYDATTWTESPVVYMPDKTPCVPPESVYVENTLSYDPVDLIWEGSSDGANNPISGYLVQRCESSDGVTFGDWIEPGIIVSASPLQVTPNETVGYYSKFRVRALSDLGEGYYSGWTESNILRKDMAPFSGFTDPELIQLETKIKAIHMIEIQNRINDLLQFNGKEAFQFTGIIAGNTKLSGWTNHIKEIRDAIDELGIGHDTWISITENRPSVDVMNQLRKTIAGIGN